MVVDHPALMIRRVKRESMNRRESMSTVSRLLTAAAVAACIVGGALAARADDSQGGNNQDNNSQGGNNQDNNSQGGGNYQHVLLISVDGMHAVDLTNYISTHPGSNLASLVAHGIIYPNALTPAPSDSFPGLLALVTGGTPKSTGVFYDDSYDRNLFAPGSNCKGLPGTETLFDESIDVNSKLVTGGGTLGYPLTQIDPAKLPMGLVNGKCVPVYPHDFIKVNTLFEVIRKHGGRTAWSDKHPAYDLVNGPSGQGVEDLFAPEVDSNDPVTGQDTTFGFHSVQRNDHLKVKSILNEIDGYKSYDDNHTNHVGVPTIFGMNFQAVSVGQKLATGNTNDTDPTTGDCPTPTTCLIGGYVDALGKTPHNGLQSGLDFVDQQIGEIVVELRHKGLLPSTLVIITAKHGQSPIDRTLRRGVDDGPYAGTPGIAQYTTDDVGLVWLSPSLQQTDYAAAKTYLLGQKVPLGIAKLLDRSELAPLYGDPFGNNRTPDFIAITDHGLIYTGGTKLAEHGGFANDDRNVALLVYNPKLDPNLVFDRVETRQVAPTILQALSINPIELDAVVQENTNVLPGIE
jgi:hypothetical protein